MYGYTIKPTVEPNDQYAKAEKALLEALDEVAKLPPEQKQQLLGEVLAMEMFKEMMNNMSRW